MSDGDLLYDVIVVGGGPMGLSAAYQCAVKRGLKVLVIEQCSFGNQHGSSAGISRQFRICYSERNLCRLAVNTSRKWDDLMQELKDDTLLHRTGTLWFGDSKITTSEGNIEAAKKNLEELAVPFESFSGKQAIEKKFPFIAGAVSDIEHPEALFVEDGGTVNVPALVNGLVKAIKPRPNCNLLDHVHVTSIDYSDPSEIRVSTDGPSGRRETHRGNKVILSAGAYVNHALSTLIPAFSQRINYIIYLWSSTYFAHRQTTTPQPPLLSNPELWPTWYFFGQPKGPSGAQKPVDANAYYGFPSEAGSGHARVAPAFTSHSDFDFHTYPPPVDQRPLDSAALNFTSAFVAKSLRDLQPTLIPEKESTCIAGFAELVKPDEEKEDNSAGFVLDFVPNTNKRIVLTTGGWGMKYIPLMGIILAELAIDGEASTEYRDDIEPMNINRGILTSPDDDLQERNKQLANLTSSQRAAKFHKLWV